MSRDCAFRMWLHTGSEAGDSERELWSVKTESASEKGSNTVPSDDAFVTELPAETQKTATFRDGEAREVVSQNKTSGFWTQATQPK